MSSSDREKVLLADRLHSAAIHILRRVREEDLSTGITPARLSALSVVVFGGPLNLGDLAEAEHVRAATMSRTVDALEEADLVTREPDPNDARGTLVRATRAGTRLLQEARARRVEVLVKELEEMEPEEIDALSVSLAALARALELPARRPVHDELQAGHDRG